MNNWGQVNHMIEKHTHPISCGFSFPEELFFHQIHTEYSNNHLNYNDFFNKEAEKNQSGLNTVHIYLQTPVYLPLNRIC